MLPDDGDWTETCRSSFNVNFNILLKQLYRDSVGKRLNWVQHEYSNNGTLYDSHMPIKK
jgi:hypothetical protein